MQSMFRGKMDPDDARDIQNADELIQQAEDKAEQLRRALLSSCTDPNCLTAVETVAAMATVARWDFNERPFPARVDSMQKAFEFAHAGDMRDLLQTVLVELSCISWASLDASKGLYQCSYTSAQNKRLVNAIEKLLRTMRGQ